MRLDLALVDKGIVSSRSRAKRAIAMGKVSVDGKIIAKPSGQVGYCNSITVMEDIDLPEGFIKLNDIQKRTGIIHHGDYVLDLGSSAGGFLLFASRIAYHVRGIEYSAKFIPQLREISTSHENITVVEGNVFTMPLSILSKHPVDVIMNDLTVEPYDSIKVLERVLTLLKPKGRILQVLKLQDTSFMDDLIDKIQAMGLTIVHLIKPKKREVYVIAVHNENTGAVD